MGRGRRVGGTRALVVVVAACTGGGDLDSFDSTDSLDRVDSGISPPSSGGVLTPRPPPEPLGASPEVPEVACSEEEATEPSDGGTDADAPDSSAAASPCDVPPPSTCLSKTSMAEYRSGPCVAKRCDFRVEIVQCPGGCFTQLDGGEQCNLGK